MKKGIEFALISARDSKPLRKRANDLGIKYCIFGQEDKVAGCEEVLSDLKIDKSHAAYIGDDNLDILRWIIVASFTVSDAVKQVLNFADIILNSKGGEGAIREISEILLEFLELFKNYFNQIN